MKAEHADETMCIFFTDLRATAHYIWNVIKIVWGFLHISFKWIVAFYFEACLQIMIISGIQGFKLF